MRLMVLNFYAFVNKENLPSFSKDINDEETKNYELPQYEVPEIYDAA